MNKGIGRQKYIQQVKPYVGKHIIKVLTGLRRVGKTTIMKQLMEFIRTEQPNINIVYLNKENSEFNHIITSNDLYKYVKERIVDDAKNAVFIDEVQEVKDFELALRQLFVEEYDIYCTGSNANMLSSDLATHLSGRYIEFQINPLTYPEFLTFQSIEDSQDAFNQYIKYGGLPYLINLPLEDEIVYGYSRSIYDTIVLKDVIGRYNIRDIDFLERLVEYLSDNLGSLVSSKKITDFLKSQGVKMSVNTVLNYLQYLENAFFIKKVKRYDIIGKKRFEINDKYYFTDLGLKHSILHFQGNDIGKIFENLVYNKLISDGYEVNVGKYKDKEIDFVAKKRSKTKYIQVAYLFPDDEVRKREFGNLLKIKNNHEKIVVSADEYATDYMGVKHYKIRDFLLS